MTGTGIPVPNSPYRKISELPAATLPFSGTELVPMNQNGTVQGKLSDIAAFFSGAGLSYITVNNESASLPGSRHTVSGTGITFADGGAGGAFTISLANQITQGSAGAANSVPVITYNAQGQLTSVSTATITPLAIGAASSTTQIATGTGLSGGGDLSQNRTIFIATTGVGAGGPTGDSGHVAQITYNSQGQLTAVASVAILPGSIGALRTASNLADVGNASTSRQNLGVDYGPSLQAGTSGQVRPFIQTSVKTATFTTSETDRGTFFLSNSSASYTAALPNNSTISGGWFAYFLNQGSGVLTVTSQNAGVNVGGTPSMAMQPGDAVLFDYDSTNTTFRAFWPAPFRNKQIFNANGSFVPPAGVYRVYVEAWGGGGGGGGGTGGSQGTGGGGGSYGADFFAVTPGTGVVVVAGAAGGGGNAGVNGNPGGLSSFGGTTLANGGGAGQQTSGVSVAGGAAAAVGEASAGGASQAVNTTGFTDGGNAPKGGQGGRGTSAAVGAAGTTPGGGGAGGNGANAGGNGGAGRVIVWF